MERVSETGKRMVEIQPTEEYERLQNTAANDWVHRSGIPYSGSYEALALKQAFVLGANTVLQFPGDPDPIMAAVRAGRAWGLTPQSHRRLVASGKGADIRVDADRDTPTVEAVGLPAWRPREAEEVTRENARESEFFRTHPRVAAEPDWDDLTPQEQQERRDQE